MQAGKRLVIEVIPLLVGKKILITHIDNLNFEDERTDGSTVGSKE